MKALILAIILTGCSASMVRAPKTSNYAPSGYKAKGTVSYYDHGASFIVESRREDAFKQMHETCSGKYEITNEYTKSDMTTHSRGITGGINSMKVNYRYFDFMCI